MSDLLVVTDIDGTLLRYEDYAVGAAAEALQACREASVPVVLSSSKTLAEQVLLRRRLGIDTPFIVENGAAVYLPAGREAASAARKLGAQRGWRMEEVARGAGGEEEALVRIVLGTAQAGLRTSLEEIAARTGLPLRGLSAMAPDEVVERLGLSPAEAELAMERQYTEPFAVLIGDERTGDEQRLDWLGRLQVAADALGLRCTLGDRLYSLQGAHDKGVAVRMLIECYEAVGGSRPWTMALGDSYNDMEMLAAVDQPVLVRRHDGSYAQGFDLPGLIRTEGVGPEGWHETVMEMLARRVRGME